VQHNDAVAARHLAVTAGEVFDDLGCERGYPFTPYRISGDDSHSASVAKSAVDDPYTSAVGLTKSAEHLSPSTRGLGDHLASRSGPPLQRVCKPSP
jgi:hypothetical protein